MRRGAGATIVLLVLSDDGLSNTVASIVMLQSLVLFPDRFLFRAKRKKLFLFLSYLYFVKFFTMSLALAYGIRDWLDLQDTTMVDLSNRRPSLIEAAKGRRHP